VKGKAKNKGEKERGEKKIIRGEKKRKGGRYSSGHGE